MRFILDMKIPKGTTLTDVIEALQQSKEGLQDGDDCLEIGDSGLVPNLTSAEIQFATRPNDESEMGRWTVTKS